MAFEKNLAAMVGGDVPKVSQGSQASHNASSETADIRDILSGFVAKGFTDLSSDDAKHYFAALSGLVGRQTAQQLAIHIFLFNQRPDTVSKPPEEKVRQFYSIGSNDPHVDNVIKGAGAFGEGPIVGLRQSHDVLSMQATNRKISTKEGDGAQSSNIQNIASSTIKTN